jgi:hypothetical protein
VLLGAATALLVTVCLPAAASAQANISIVSAGPANGNPDVLTVVVDDANPSPGDQITKLTVDFCPASVSACSDTTPPTFSLTVSPTAQPDAAGQTTIEVTIPEGSLPDALPPGTYSMAFDVTDSSPETDTGLTAPDQADLAFIYTTTITGSATTSYPGTSAMISGEVTGVPPGGTSPVPLSGVPVYLSTSSTPIAMTDGEGSYTAQVALTSGTTAYSVDVQESQTWGSAGVSVPVSRQTDATMVSAQVAPQDFVYGSKAKATLTGKASYQSNGHWQPLAGYPVQVTVGDKKASVITRADGQFSLTYPPSDGTNWLVVVGNGGLLGYSYANGVIHVAVPLAFKSFSATLSNRELITVSGCVGVTVPGFAAPGGIVVVQYRTSQHDPWNFLTWSQMTVSGGPSCHGDDRSYFTVTHVIPSPANTYYRAYVPATANYQSAASRALYRWRYFTQILSLKVSPLPVAKHGKITVGGQLQVYVKGWRDYGKQDIWIVILAPGSTDWNWLTKNVEASADGQFKGTAKAKGGWPNGALVTAYFPGNNTHFQAFGNAVCIKVTGEPNLCGRHGNPGPLAALPVRPPA